MPLLHIDLGAVAQLLPEAHRASFLARPVHARLAFLVKADNPSVDSAMRERAHAALAALEAPAYIGVDAVRVTLRSCAALNRTPVARCDFLVAALGTPAGERRGRHLVGKWYRQPGDRWLLTVTGCDLAHAALALRT